MDEHFMADDAPPWPPEGMPQPEIVWQDILDTYSRMIPTWLPAPAWPPPKPDPALEHWLMVLTAKAFRVRPYLVGAGYPPCACHPAPNPAARDYRRRTKHRRRRR